MGIAVCALGGVLVWAVWAGVGSPAASTSAARETSLSPADARQREILKDNLGKPADAALTRLYHDLNVRYFAERLPDMPVRWDERLADVGALADRSFVLEGMFGEVAGRTAIVLNTNLQADEDGLTRALCHEMVHAYLYELGDHTTSHGPAFQAELERLAHSGAFKGIVATDAERQALRAWLDSEGKRLDSTSDDLAREGSALEDERADLERAIADVSRGDGAGSGPRPDQASLDALNARREAYNARVTDVNARVVKGREDVSAFNVQVNRYNLMLLYPDGADAEARVPVRAAAK